MVNREPACIALPLRMVSGCRTVNECDELIFCKICPNLQAGTALSLSYSDFSLAAATRAIPPRKEDPLPHFSIRSNSDDNGVTGVLREFEASTLPLRRPP